MTIKDIAITAGCSSATVYKYAKLFGIKVKPGKVATDLNKKDAEKLLRQLMKKPKVKA